MNRRKLLISIGGVVTLSGCMGPSEDIPQRGGGDRATKAQRWVDCDADVICFEVGPGAGLSCMPIEDTNIDRDEVCNNA